MKKAFVVATVLFIGSIGAAQAIPIKDGTDFENYHYLNSGDLVGVYVGNDKDKEKDMTFLSREIESYLKMVAGSFTLTRSSSTITLYGWNAGNLQDPSDGKLDSLGSSDDEGKIQGFSDGYYSGEWLVTPSTNTISLYTVKAGHYFALYHLKSGANTGSWSVADITAKYGKKETGFALSHFTAFNSGFEPVPEPTTMLLFGTGIAGLAAVGRRKRK